MYYSESSRTSRYRQRKAGQLSIAFSLGDGDAALRLRQRRLGLQGIDKHGWVQRLALANAARARYRREHEIRETTAQALRPFSESTREL
jgi:hypothetical protein